MSLCVLFISGGVDFPLGSPGLQRCFAAPGVASGLPRLAQGLRGQVEPVVAPSWRSRSLHETLEDNADAPVITSLLQA